MKQLLLFAIVSFVPYIIMAKVPHEESGATKVVIQRAPASVDKMMMRYLVVCEENEILLNRKIYLLNQGTVNKIKQISAPAQFKNKICVSFESEGLIEYPLLDAN